MNRSERNMVARQALHLYNVVHPMLESFSSTLDTLRDEQESRLDGLPDSLRDASLGQNLEDASSMLECAADLLAEIDGMLEDVVFSTLEASSKGKTTDKKHESVLCPTTGEEKRSERFNAVFTASQMNRLRALSLSAGESMNGIICRLLDSALAEAEGAD